MSNKKRHDQTHQFCVGSRAACMIARGDIQIEDCYWMLEKAVASADTGRKLIVDWTNATINISLESAIDFGPDLEVFTRDYHYKCLYLHVAPSERLLVDTAVMGVPQNSLMPITVFDEKPLFTRAISDCVKDFPSRFIQLLS